MKDLVISGKRIKRELRFFAACVVAMELLNVYSIIRYEGEWTEVIMSLGYVVTAAVAVYLLIGAVRLVVTGILKLFRKTT